ncbi:MAG TPA: glutathione S-transferase N-terminal domain-containing protein [Thermoleophilaceae bacterium]|jgi:glutathione S-transferase
MSELPVLWHIEVSHYNEKVRWALDHKGIAHRRRAPMPGAAHMAHALRLTRRLTFPVLELDGQAIGDSTAIIAELERLRPDPPLLPADPAERRRALELEEFFDTELGPHIRRVGFQSMFEPQNRDLMLDELVKDSPLVRRAFTATYPVVRRTFKARYGVYPDRVRAGLEKTHAALERVESERAGRDHLVGDSFTVADLTAAALFAPLLQPDELEYKLTLPPETLPLQAELREHPAGRWALDTYRRHRGVSAEVA